IIIIEHKLDEFIDIFDRIMLLDDGGRLIVFTNPADLFKNYLDELQELGVWIPQIPKYSVKILKENIQLSDFPLNYLQALNSIENLKEDHDRALDILDSEVKKILNPEKSGDDKKED